MSELARRTPRRPRPADVGPLEVVARPNDSPEFLIKRFIRKVRDEGVVQEFLLHTKFRSKRQLRDLKRRKTERREREKRRKDARSARR